MQRMTDLLLDKFEGLAPAPRPRGIAWAVAYYKILAVRSNDGRPARWRASDGRDLRRATTRTLAWP